jgi:hypothetical protein
MSAARTVTEAELVAAFDEWSRRYDEDPDSFNVPDDRTYGEACAPYLLWLLDGAPE